MMDNEKTTITVIEADAWFALQNQADANGRLDSVVTTIDNRLGLIKNVRINATTAVTVLVIKLPDSDYKRLRQSA